MPPLSSRSAALVAVLLAIVTFAVYSPVRNHAFVNYDDDDYVVHNSHIHSGLTENSIKWAWTTMAEGNWHPLTWISHAVDCGLFGLDPGWHHLMNLGLHLLNAFLLAWFLILVTGAPWRSLIVAALFALHPLNVESVAWVAERKNLLSTCFFLLALIAYYRYAGRPSALRYMVLLAAFFLALASKPMVVTLPFLLVLIDYWPLQRIKGWITPSVAGTVPQVTFSRCVLEKLPLFVMSAASSVITVIAQRSGGAVKTLEAFPFAVRLENAACAYVMYLGKAMFPWRLAVFYPHPGSELSAWKGGLALLFLLVVTWLAWKARTRAPYLVIGWLWFIGTLVPVIGIVQVGAQAMADRYAYVPLIGVFVAIVWGIADLCGRYRVKTLWPAAASAVVLTLVSWMTWRQVAYWSDSYALWTHALAVTPDNPVSENQMGMALIALDRQEEAMTYFQRSIALGTHDPTSYLNVGSYLNEHERQHQAIPLLETALRMQGDDQNRLLAHLNLGFAYASSGDYQNARLHFRASLQLNREGVEETIGQLTRFVAAHPSTRDYMKLGLLCEEAGRNAEAAAAFEKVLQMDPSIEAARDSVTAMRSIIR